MVLYKPNKLVLDLNNFGGLHKEILIHPMLLDNQVQMEAYGLHAVISRMMEFFHMMLILMKLI